jgi:hypothetical protein
MKSPLLVLVLALVLALSTAAAQTPARPAAPTNSGAQGVVVGGVPFVNAPVYGPQGPGQQFVPVYWWLDPYYSVYWPGNFLSPPGYFIPPPIIPDPSVLGPFVGPYPPAIMGGQPPIFMPPQTPAQGNAAAPRNDPPKKEEKAKDPIDQQAVMHKELRAGNADFALGRFNAALQHYEKAGDAQPLAPQPLFHQAQAWFAQGQYGKAVVAIQRGLKWQPNWPQADFQVRALYGDRTSAFDQHLNHLAQAIEKNPNDDSLLFLMGYQLWFDGKKEKAAVLFKRAASLTIATEAIDRFLK